MFLRAATSHRYFVKNIELKKKVDDVNNTFAKFVRRKEILDKIIGSPCDFYDRTELGYEDTPKYKKKYVNVFTKSSSSNVHYLYCNRNNHISLKCPNRYKVANKDLKWVVKT